VCQRETGNRSDRVIVRVIEDSGNWVKMGIIAIDLEQNVKLAEGNLVCYWQFRDVLGGGQ
jgi:exopolysaccharide biosynthesis protein